MPSDPPLVYILNASNTVQDQIDGEVLAIRSDNGAYYSMRGAAATAWCALISGCDWSRIVAGVAGHHGGEPAAVDADLRRFAEALKAESLLLSGGEPDGSAELSLPSETIGLPWQEPVFEIYTDMRDLLLFDPIHEVDDSGWPRVTPAP